MANTVSAKKMTRKIAKRTAINKSRRSRVRTFVRKVEEALAAGNQTDAAAALRAAEPEMMRAAQKGILHKNTASRKVSRLASRVKALGACCINAVRVTKTMHQTRPSRRVFSCLYPTNRPRDLSTLPLDSKGASRGENSQAQV